MKRKLLGDSRHRLPKLSRMVFSVSSAVELRKPALWQETVSRCQVTQPHQSHQTGRAAPAISQEILLFESRRLTKCVAETVLLFGAVEGLGSLG